MGQPQIVITNTAPTSDNLITDSELYASTGDAEALSFDIHIEVDTIGSRQRYTK